MTFPTCVKGYSNIPGKERRGEYYEEKGPIHIDLTNSVCPNQSNYKRPDRRGKTRLNLNVHPKSQTIQKRADRKKQLTSTFRKNHTNPPRLESVKVRKKVGLNLGTRRSEIIRGIGKTRFGKFLKNKRLKLVRFGENRKPSKRGCNEKKRKGDSIQKMKSTTPSPVDLTCNVKVPVFGNGVELTMQSYQKKFQTYLQSNVRRKKSKMME